MRKFKKPIFSNNDDIDPRFAETVFVVEANSFETLHLWERYHGKHTWEQINPGTMYQTGELEKRPVCTCFQWVKIDGRLVVFYENTSQVVDTKQVEEWLKKHCNPKWDRGTRMAQTNAMNFHHCIDAINELNKVGCW